MPGRLTICATPIGNLDDISSRLAATLEDADIIFAEDTRRTGGLLTHLGVSTPMRSFFAGNEQRRVDELRAHLVDGHHVALVSDAGMPTISDPGSLAVEAAVEVDAMVSAIPGPSAVTTAMAVSGLPGDRFLFLGFLARKGRERSVDVQRVADSTVPVVVFAAPSRVHRDLEAIAEAAGDDRRVSVARELTKLHEEVWRGTVADAVTEFTDEGRRRGEFTIVVDGAPEPSATVDDAVADARERIAAGASTSDAVRAAASRFGVSRRKVYDVVLKGES